LNRAEIDPSTPRPKPQVPRPRLWLQNSSLE